MYQRLVEAEIEEGRALIELEQINAAHDRWLAKGGFLFACFLSVLVLGLAVGLLVMGHPIPATVVALALLVAGGGMAIVRRLLTLKTPKNEDDDA